MKKLHIELANTPIKREMGLMGRKKMAENNGMLFDFPSSRRLAFWMSNTYIPLDIAFINKEGIVTEIREMVPMSTRCVSSKSYCKYALEVNKGWFSKNNITEGARVAGFGIKAKSDTRKTAQMTPQNPAEAFPVEPGLMPPMPMPQEAPQQDLLTPDIVLNKTHEEMLEEANVTGKELVLMYVTKGGVSLPPKVIIPPFTFEKDEDGESNAIVKAWDAQDASWKSFLIDNIIDLNEKEEPEKEEEILIQEKDI